MKIRILEVGPRDGLQNIQKAFTLEEKIELVQKLVNSGLKHIEAGAFVNPKAVPQMADSSELLKHLVKQHSDVAFYSLVPNIYGLEKALECGVSHIGLLSSCCETFTEKNLNTNITGSLNRIKEIIEECPDEVFKRLYLSMSFHSPWTGVISNEAFNTVLEKCADLAIDEIVISDTTGKGTPDLVNNRIFLTQKYFDTDHIACHFHDTFQNGLPNVAEALKCRVSKFDSSVAGLGGCPYSPGSSGNISTNLLVDYLVLNNHETSVILNKLNTAAEFVNELLEK